VRLSRPSLLTAAAALSAVLFVVTVVGWVRSYPHSGCVGWALVREATPAVIAVDSYTMQSCRGRTWCGRCRITVDTLLGFRQEPSAGAAGLEEVTRYLDVFGIPEAAGPLSGFGSASGSSMEFVGHGFLVYEIEGVVVPCWFLALVTGLPPALWVWWRARRSEVARPAAPGRVSSVGGS